MVRENQKYLNKLQIFLDLFFVVVSYTLAHYIRFNFLQDAHPSLDITQLAQIILSILPFYMILYNMFDLYSTRRTKPFYIEVSSIIKTNILGTLLLMTLLFVFKFIHFSRLTLIFFFLLNILFTLGTRLIIRIILKKYRRLGYNLKHCLVIGDTPSSSYFIQKTKKNPHWGYRIVGIITTSTSKTKIFETYPVLGNLDALESIVFSKRLDMIFIGASGTDLEQLGNILYTCEKSGIKTHIIPYYYQYIPAKPYMDDLDGLPIIDIRHVPLDNVFKHGMKRFFDICFSLTAIILTLPILIISALMIKLTSKGPILFKQERVGLNRENFYMYKFRSMRVQTEEEEKSQWTTKNDPRKTWWGNFMRRTSIDELPQFFNVLKGDMSVVGPRPERPYFVEQFKETVPRYMIKHQVRPGITGWAQINGYRGDTSITARINHDLYYIENWTFAFDLKIILLTITKGFINPNAY